MHARWIMFSVDDFLAVEDLVTAELPVRQRVMRGLAALVDESFGVEAASLAELLRERGGIHTLVRLLDDESAGVHHRAMMVLGNLVGEFFDEEAGQSLVQLCDAGGLERVLAHLERPFPSCLYATACLQNMTAIDDACCSALREAGCVPQLQALLANENADVAKFAAGTLANIQSKVGLGAGADEELNEVIDQRWRQEASDAIRAVVAARNMQTKWRTHHANVQARLQAAADVSETGAASGFSLDFSLAAAPSSSFEVDLMPSKERPVDILSQLDDFGQPLEELGRLSSGASPELGGVEVASAAAGSGAEPVEFGETFGSMSAMGEDEESSSDDDDDDDDEKEEEEEEEEDDDDGEDEQTE